MSLLVWIVTLLALVFLILYVRLWRKAPEHATASCPCHPQASQEPVPVPVSVQVPEPEPEPEPEHVSEPETPETTSAEV